MTHGTSFSDIFGGYAFGELLVLGIILFQIGIYVFYSYTQYILSKKMEIEYSWMAWIPGLNFFNKLFIAGKTIGWWLKWFILPFAVGGILSASLFPIIREYWVPGTIVLIMMMVVFIGVIKLNHGVSTRTGHGKWWTAGLIFAGWLFWPVTAIHYQKGDEVTPRPFTGWRKVLLILGALIFPILIILGILAAAIFPAMNGYLDRSRDAARMSHLKMISTTLGAYYADRESYPNTPESGCVSADMFPAEYIYGTQGFNDPMPTNIMPGCDGSDGTYAYRSIRGRYNIPGYVIGATMESGYGGNSNLPIDDITADTVLVKGSGSYYYIVQ